jgi:hypothetical protein
VNNTSRGSAGNANSTVHGASGNSNASRGSYGNANSPRGTTGNSNAAGRNSYGNNTNRSASNVNANGRAGTAQTGARGGVAASSRGGVGTNTRTAGGVGNRGNAVGNRGNAVGGRGTATAGASHHQPVGTKTVEMHNGGHATFRSDGHVRSVQAHGMTINHGMRGERHIVAERNGHRVVVMGRHAGYSERAYYHRGGREYVQRTYYRGGRAYAYGYRSYYYRGYAYYGYAPAYYYQPVYYGWAYNPWPAPVYYNWGWAGQPWYGYYGGYYAPYPAYPSAAFWLTDYVISENLRLAYEAQAAAGLVPPHFEAQSSDALAALWSSDPLIAANFPSAYPDGAYLLGAANSGAASAPMPADVKQAISDQIKNEIAAEKAAAANKDTNSAPADLVPAALDPNIRYFVVASDQDLTTSEGTECTLTAGDVVYRTGDTPDADNIVDAAVKSSKKDECGVGATVGVQVSELQEMHNALRQTMDEGLKKLASNSGKNGLPAAPDTRTTDGEVPPPTADANVAQDLQQTQKDADQAEAELKKPN